MAPGFIVSSCYHQSILLLVTFGIAYLHGYTIEDSHRLLANLTTHYNPLFRPRYNQTEAVEVHVTFDLASIHEFDEVNGKIATTAILVAIWYDDFYKWNPADFGGQTSITVDTARIWLPNLVNSNSVDNIDRVSEDWHLLNVDHDGRVMYILGDIFISSCSVDVTYYPWDRQWCQIFIFAWGFGPHEVKMFPSQNKILTSYYTENGIWTMADSSSMSESESGGTTVIFELVLDRKPDFVIVNVIAPIVFMSFLNVLIFLIPTECGEKISYCITMLLAIAVFLTLVGDYLPKTSKPMSNYSIYLLAVLIISVCITLATIVSVAMYYRHDKHRVGALCKWLVTISRCKCCRTSLKNMHSREFIEQVDKPQFSQAADVTRRKGSLPNGKGGSENVTTPDSNEDVILYKQWVSSRQSEESRDSDSHQKDVTWQQVSKVVDTLCFILFLTAVVIVTVGFLYNVSQGQPQEKT